MAKRERSRGEIIHDVLEVTLNEENPRKTRIMQRSYLNTVTFSKYFDFMLNGGFIVKCNTEAGC
ncbi:putative transcriptional regulator [groundwater metagenome]